jgi:hypothetical protein
MEHVSMRKTTIKQQQAPLALPVELIGLNANPPGPITLPHTTADGDAQAALLTTRM